MDTTSTDSRQYRWGCRPIIELATFHPISHSGLCYSCKMWRHLASVEEVHHLLHNRNVLSTAVQCPSIDRGSTGSGSMGQLIPLFQVGVKEYCLTQLITYTYTKRVFVRFGSLSRTICHKTVAGRGRPLPVGGAIPTPFVITPICPPTFKYLPRSLLLSVANCSNIRLAP